MGCGNILTIRNDAEGTYGISGDFGINYGKGYHVVRVAPSSLTTGPLTIPSVPVSDTTVIQDGDHGDPPFKSMGNYSEEYSTFLVDKPQVLDIAQFVTCSGPISKSRLGFRVSDKAKVLAESWGRGGTRFLREWDFQHAAVYEGTQDGNPEPVPYSLQTQTVIHGLRTLRFRKHPIAWMGAFFGPGAGSVASPIAPVVLSVKGPWQPARMWWSSGDWGASIWQLQLPGTGTGTYTFGVEAAATAMLWPGHIGQSPRLFLVSADADYPACTVLRVRSKASDGHPLCY